MKNIKSSFPRTSLGLTGSSIKSLLAAAIIVCGATFLNSAMVEAQSLPIGLGIGLGRGLLSAAANRHRSSSSTSDPSDPSNSSSYYSGYPGSYGSGSSSSRRAKNSAISSYNKSIKYFNNQKYEEAMPFLVQTIQIDPRMGSAYALMAVCQSKLGHYPEAMQTFELAEHYGSHYSGLLYEKGMCAARMRDYQTADQCLKQFVAKGRHEAQSDDAEKALEIIQHNFGNQSDGDYLSDASRAGTRRWANASQPLRVCIQENPNLRGYRPEFAAIVKQSFDEWSQGTNGRVAFVYTVDPAEAQIKVSWTDNEADLGSGDSKELGITLTQFSDGVIDSADIKLLTLVGYCRDDVTELFPQAKCVALHEIGHALGLQHSTEPFDTMYPLVPPKGLEFSLTRRDLNTVTALYSQNAPQVTSMSGSGSVSQSGLAADQGK